MDAETDAQLIADMELHTAKIVEFFERSEKSESIDTNEAIEIIDEAYRLLDEAVAATE